MAENHAVSQATIQDKEKIMCNAVEKSTPHQGDTVIDQTGVIQAISRDTTQATINGNPQITI